MSKEFLNKFVADNEKKLLDFLKELISIKSPSAGEKSAAECTAKEMKKLGYENIRFDGAGNVIGELGRGGKLLLLSAHLDTAGVADPGAWSVEPYSGEIKDGKIFGRGAGDNKGALSAMVYAGKLWKELHPGADYKVLVAGTVLEEDADGYGMQALIEELPVKPSFVMVGKPSNGAINRGHRGRMEVQISVKGEGCHASTPEKGKNALYIAAKVLNALEDYAGKLPSDSFLGKASLAATLLDVKPGKFNMVPDNAVICVDRRITAGETYESVIEGFKKALPFHEVEVSCFPYKNKTWTNKSIELEKYFPSWVLPEDHPLVKAAVDAGLEAFNKNLQVGKWTVSTDGVGSMGRHGIPTIGYGPGERRVVDDHQKIADLLDAVRFYAGFCHSVKSVI
ncbi:MAG: YgeY family selenium metabolism-linked hydrolase [Firmicutes bacterium]|nr:YgeY family selenium metabolism-linked hydrolase [Bacillota bacterium]